MFGSANGMQSGRGGRGVAGLTRGFLGARGAGTRVSGVGTCRPGAETTGAGDGGTMEQRKCGGGVPRLPGEPTAKWRFLGMRPPGSPPPRCRVRFGGGGSTPSCWCWGDGQQGGRELSDPRVRGGGWGRHQQCFGVTRAGTGSGVCLGTPKRRDGARVSDERFPKARMVSDGVFAPRGGGPRLVTSVKSQNSEPQQWDLPLPPRIWGWS